MSALPLHAYIPGETDRHPDGAFDGIRASARQGMAAEDLANCAAFSTGLLYLEQGYYWEAHEVLEPVWLALPEATPERYAVQALIQIANARLKLRMERPRAALRLCDMAEDLAARAGDPAMGLPQYRLLDWISATRQMANQSTRSAL